MSALAETYTSGERPPVAAKTVATWDASEEEFVQAAVRVSSRAIERLEKVGTGVVAGVAAEIISDQFGQTPDHHLELLAIAIGAGTSLVRSLTRHDWQGGETVEILPDSKLDIVKASVTSGAIAAVYAFVRRPEFLSAVGDVLHTSTKHIEELYAFVAQGATKFLFPPYTTLDVVLAIGASAIGSLVAAKALYPLFEALNDHISNQ